MRKCGLVGVLSVNVLKLRTRDRLKRMSGTGLAAAAGPGSGIRDPGKGDAIGHGRDAVTTARVWFGDQRSGNTCLNLPRPQHKPRPIRHPPPLIRPPFPATCSVLRLPVLPRFPLYSLVGS